MGKQRDPKRDRAFEIYKASGGETHLNVIAAQLGVESGKIRVWKNRDNWDVTDSVTTTVTLQKKERNKKTVTLQSAKEKKKAPKEKTTKYTEIENDELTDKQRLFCLYYLKCFNATLSAIKAGYAKESAHVQGSVLLSYPKIRDEIKRIKSTMTQDVFIGAMDIFNSYMAIAFSDIADYMEFGQSDVIMTNKKGNILYDDDGKAMTTPVNFVNFKNSKEIDGSIISEVKQGKEGVSIKLHDKMKALEKLEKYFDLLPDKHKRMIEDERLKMDRERLELDKARATGEGDLDEELIDDWVGAVMDDGSEDIGDQGTQGTQ